MRSKDLGWHQMESRSQNRIHVQIYVEIGTVLTFLTFLTLHLVSGCKSTIEVEKVKITKGAAPAIVSVSVTEHEVTLAWSAVAKASYYKVFRGLFAQDDGQIVAFGDGGAGAVARINESNGALDSAFGTAGVFRRAAVASGDYVFAGTKSPKTGIMYFAGSAASGGSTGQDLLIFALNP